MPAVEPTADQLSQVAYILHQLDHLATVGKDENRRHAKRLQLRMTLPAILLLPHAQPTLRVFSRNLSTSGIGFVSRRLFKKGELVVLSFQVPEQPHKLLLAKVSFCRYLRNGMHESGAEFLESMTSPTVSVPPQWLSRVPKAQSMG